MKVCKRFTWLVIILILTSVALLWASPRPDSKGSPTPIILWPEGNSQPQAKVISLFTRHYNRSPIELTMLVAYSPEITKIIRDLLEEEVTPLVFSVSTLPLTTTEFYPENLRFEQNGRSWWSPQSQVFPLEEDSKFGGVINGNEVQQGIILLPDWFDVRKPLTISYDMSNLVDLGNCEPTADTH